MPSFPSNGTYTITNVESTLVLDAEGGRITSGTKVIGWTPTGGSNQKWDLNWEGQVCTIKPSGSSLYVAPALPNPGSNVYLSSNKAVWGMGIAPSGNLQVLIGNLAELTYLYLPQTTAGTQCQVQRPLSPIPNDEWSFTAV